jgi:hypothetical protein
VIPLPTGRQVITPLNGAFGERTLHCVYQEGGDQMGSVVKKRRKKMRKHKHKKQLDRDRHKKKK